PSPLRGQNLRPPLQNTLRDPRIFYRLSRRKLLAWGHWAKLSRRMPEESYWLPWKVCVKGRRFVSAGLAGHVSAKLGDSQVSEPPFFMRPPHRYGRKRPKSSSQAFLPSGTHVIASQTERNTSVDRRTTFELRVD